MSKVYINLPYLLACSNELGVHKSIPSICLVDCELLAKVCSHMLNLEVEQDGFTELIDSCNLPKETEAVMSILKIALREHAKVNVEESYSHIDFNAVNFDVVRKYITNPQGLLENTEVLQPVTFYSSLNEAEALQMRELMNDTDYNRYQYLLSESIKILNFDDGKLLHSTFLMLKLVLLMFVLSLSAEPVPGHSFEQLYSSIIMYGLDLIIRTRVISHWYPKHGKDIRAYDKSNAFIALYGMEKPEERFKSTMNILKKTKFAKLSDFATYPQYIQSLDKYSIVIDGEKYYHFNIEIMNDLAQLGNNIETLRYLQSDEFKSIIDQDNIFEVNAFEGDDEGNNMIS